MSSRRRRGANTFSSLHDVEMASVENVLDDAKKITLRTRSDAWFYLMLTSAITIGSLACSDSPSVTASSNKYGAAFASSCFSFLLSLTATVCHRVKPMQQLFTAQISTWEIIFSAIVFVCWCIILPITVSGHNYLANKGIETVDVNLLFSCWSSFAIASYICSTHFSRVSESRLNSTITTLWVGMFFATLALMGTAISLGSSPICSGTFSTAARSACQSLSVSLAVSIANMFLCITIFSIIISVEYYVPYIGYTDPVLVLRLGSALAGLSMLIQITGVYHTSYHGGLRNAQNLFLTSWAGILIAFCLCICYLDAFSIQDEISAHQLDGTSVKWNTSRSRESNNVPVEVCSDPHKHVHATPTPRFPMSASTARHRLRDAPGLKGDDVNGLSKSVSNHMNIPNVQQGTKLFPNTRGDPPSLCSSSTTRKCSTTPKAFLSKEGAVSSTKAPLQAPLRSSTKSSDEMTFSAYTPIPTDNESDVTSLGPVTDDDSENSLMKEGRRAAQVSSVSTASTPGSSLDSNELEPEAPDIPLRKRTRIVKTTSDSSGVSGGRIVDEHVSAAIAAALAQSQLQHDQALRGSLSASKRNSTRRRSR